MIKTIKVHNRYAAESIESLMLLVLFAEQSVRHEALAELRNRRNEEHPDPMPESYSTNLGIITC